MKVLITVIACAICVCNSFSQSYNNNWAFGDSCGLNFSSGEPVFFETVMESFEACASISDSAGNLLFYTNGEKVWNKNHEVMPNGEGLEIGKTGAFLNYARSNCYLICRNSLCILFKWRTVFIRLKIFKNRYEFR
ncbi:MAG: hypothetical protein IPH61_11015 [Bacteroidetes bacterium]|nr:hypothetical protein [Bacteroidota bacterium]